MPRPRKGNRLLPIEADGLYRHGNGYRYFRCRADGSKEASQVFLSKVKALQAKREEQAVLDGRTDVTVGGALEDYQLFMEEEGHRNEGGNKPGAVEDTVYKIGTLLADKELLLEALTDDKICQALYDDLRRRPKPRELIRCRKAAVSRGQPQNWVHEMGEALCLCRPYAVDSHRQMLLETKTFLRWCITKGFLTKSGMEEIRGKGKRKEGKEQLRVDAGRQWLDQAMFNASVRGDEQAVACMMTVYMGLSGTEITDRLVEDVDDNCTRLWITNGKTRNREKAVDIPGELQPFVRVLVEGKGPEQTLWKNAHWRDWINRGVKKICRQAGVKEVTGHGMRGLHGTLNLLGGAEQEEARVVAAMRHAPGTFATTTGPKYLDPSALRRRTQQRALGVLKGGKS